MRPTTVPLCDRYRAFMRPKSPKVFAVQAIRRKATLYNTTFYNQEKAENFNLGGLWKQKPGCHGRHAYM
jgi:hypothetical protein